MQFIKNRLRLASGVLAGILLFSQFAMVPVSVGATDNHNDVTICHATGSNSNPFEEITVDDDAVNGNGDSDHNRDGHQNGEDIIPPGSWDADGRNWTATNQAIWNNDCETTRVEVKKVVSPANDTGLFNLKIEGDTYAANVGNGGTTGEVYVDEDENITVSETQGTNTSLNSYTTSIVCKDDNGTGDVVKSGNATSVTIDDNDIKNGDDIVCIITNTRKAGNLKVIKDVVNDNGGTKTYADFTFKTSAGDSPRSFDATTSPDGEKVVSLPTGTNFTVTEVQANTGGYATTYSGSCNGTIVEGQTKVCTITNNDVTGQLRVVKEVVSDNGGDADASDFTLYVNGQTKTQNQYFNVNAGVYTVTESGPSGYGQTSLVCKDDNSQQVLTHPVTVGLGQKVTCTVTNSDNAPTLKVIKHVINNNGGTKLATNFLMSVTGTDVSDNEFPGDENGTVVTLDAGNYSVTESGPSGYGATYSADCSGTIALGEYKTCIITNDDNVPILTLLKQVWNDDGGTADADDWFLKATGPSTFGGWGGAISDSNFAAGTYTLSEHYGPNGYAASAWTCIGGSQNGNQITVEAGQIASCGIVNNDKPAEITVTKEVINNNGGDAEVSDFDLWVDSTQVLSGVSNEFDGNEWYFVKETDGPDGYKKTSLKCWDTTGNYPVAVSNPFYAKLDHSYHCKIVNDDVAPKLTIIKDSTPDDIQVFDFVIASPANYFYQHFQLNDNNTSWPVDDDKTFYLDTGNYTVTEAATDGWYLDGIHCWGDGNWNKDLANGKVMVELGLGDELTCKFKNNKFGEVKGFKFEDLNKNGYWNNGEPKLSDWTITLDEVEGDFAASTVTDQNGWYKFEDLKNGWYNVCEEQQSGWVQTTPDSYNGCEKVYVHAGDTDFVKFGNFQLGEAKGVKFNDFNGNGQRDVGEPTLKNWTIKLTKKCEVQADERTLQSLESECEDQTWTTLTDQNGAYSFTDLGLGTYVICEVQQATWTQTAPNTADGCVEFVIETSGHTEIVDFGNKANPQILGESTTTPQIAGTLVNTGASASKSLAFGLVILGALGAIHFLHSRRKDYAR